MAAGNLCITFKSHFSHNELIMNTLRYFDFGASRSCCCSSPASPWWCCLSFWLSETAGFSGTVQYMASSGAPMPTLAAIIAVMMEVPAAILIVLGFFTRPLAVIFIFYTLGTAVIGHHYWDMTGDAVLPNMINFWKNVSIAGALCCWRYRPRRDFPRPPLIGRHKKGRIAAFLCNVNAYA
jgi:putative oxidoreductase